jgi:hypothetical protein
VNRPDAGGLVEDLAVERGESFEPHSAGCGMRKPNGGGCVAIKQRFREDFKRWIWMEGVDEIAQCVFGKWSAFSEGEAVVVNDRTV